MILTILAAYLVDLQRIHTRMDLLGYLVEHACVHDTRLADTLYLLRGLDQLARRHQLTLVLPEHDGLIHFRWLLSRQTVPSLFLESVHLPYYI